jgi:hypothetical protein
MKARRSHLTAAAAAVASTFGCEAASAATIVVHPDGTGDYATIQAAIGGDSAVTARESEVRYSRASGAETAALAVYTINGCRKVREIPGAARGFRTPVTCGSNCSLLAVLVA